MSAVPPIFKSDHTYIRTSLRLAAKAIASGDWSTARDIYQEVGAIGATLETLAEEMLEHGRLS
jgi:hypothetical protein